LGGEGDNVGLKDARLVKVTGRGVAYLNGATGTAADLLGVAFKNIDGTTANGAEAKQTNFYGIHIGFFL